MNATKATIASTPAPLESPHGGYLAAVVVNRIGCSIDGPLEADRDTSMTIDMRYLVVVGIVVLSLLSSVLVASAQAGLLH